MKPEDRRILDHARTLDGEERARYLRRACDNDERRLREINRTLGSEDRDRDDLLARGGENGRSYPQPGEQEWIGSFRVLSELGRGAMGVVLLAEQRSPRRKVALKVLRPEVLNPIREKRFEIETESLAMLKHPGIAPIFESGRTNIGGRSHPFFAMELVRGRPLDEYARTIDQRLGLGKMISICEAVDHAHRRGVVHRDLKPANILVDESGRARILDFGVARLIGTDANTPDLVGTLGYMSPEQLRGERDVDGRTDVYALGVILHEMLTGDRPFELGGMTVDDALGLIERTPWERTVGTRRLGRELDAIIAKAIATEPENRYESALEMGADIRRFLNTQPVAAVEGGVGYRSGKFVARNRGLVSLATIAVLAVGVGIAGVSWQAARATKGWHRASEEQARAETALEKAERQRRIAVAMNVFMIEMLTSADPESTLGSELTVREVLDTAGLTIDSQFRDEPDIHAGVRMALANTYLSLGELAAAQAHAQRMLEVSREAYGERDPLTADAKRTLALVLSELGQYERSAELIGESSGVILELGDPIERAKVLSEQARVEHAAGRYESSLALWEQSEAVFREQVGADHRETLVVMNNRGMALKDVGRLAESERLMEEVYQTRVRVFGEEHPQTLVALNILASVIQKQGRNEEAAEMLREVVERRRRVLGDEHFSTLLAMGNLGVALIRLNRLDEAEVLTREALEGHRERFGDGHARTLVLMGNLAFLLEDRGRLDEAAELYRETIELQRTRAGGLDPETWATMNNLAMLLMNTGKAAEARPLFEELLGMCEAMLPADHYYTAIFRDNYGECLIELGDFDPARRALEQSRPVLVRVFGEGHERVRKSELRWERLLREAGLAGG